MQLSFTYLPHFLVFITIHEGEWEDNNKETYSQKIELSEPNWSKYEE